MLAALFVCHTIHLANLGQFEMESRQMTNSRRPKMQAPPRSRRREPENSLHKASKILATSACGADKLDRFVCFGARFIGANSL